MVSFPLPGPAHGNGGQCAGAMSSILASLVISEGKLWLDSHGSLGRAGISIVLMFRRLLYAKFRDYSDIITNKHVTGEFAILVIFSKNFPLFLLSFSGYQI